MDKNYLSEIFKSQKDYFYSGTTKDLSFRLNQLEKLRKGILQNEQLIYEGLKKDLHKSREETFLTEIYMVLAEIKYMKKNLKNLMKPHKVKTPLVAKPGKSFIYPEPYGSTLIISPWNYPFQLLMSPLVGAMAAGNCSVLKPSEYCPNTSEIIEKIIEENFSPKYIKVIQGGIEETSYLLEQPFDYIFFTGSPSVGKIVMSAAAKNLTPVTLELGGKSPCIVEKDADIELAAKRIAWGKFLNSGQTCIAPDYIFVSKEISDSLTEKITHYIKEFYGEDASLSENYVHIINEKHFLRLSSYMENQNIISGGYTDINNLFIAPTLIKNPSVDSPVMQEEIFGPLLPVIEYENIQEAVNFIKKNPKPLALYLFTQNEDNKTFVYKNTYSGGMCINDVLSHITTEYLPFGGVGNSGMGQYHGKSTFDTFTHYKSIMERGKFDIKAKFPPYKKTSFIIRFLKK